MFVSSFLDVSYNINVHKKEVSKFKKQFLYSVLRFFLMNKLKSFLGKVNYQKKDLDYEMIPVQLKSFLGKGQISEKDIDYNVDIF